MCLNFLIIFSLAVPAFADSQIETGDVRINSGASILGTGTMTLSGDLSVGENETVMNSGEVVFNGDAQLIGNSSYTTTFGDVTFTGVGSKNLIGNTNIVDLRWLGLDLEDGSVVLADGKTLTFSGSLTDFQNSNTPELVCGTSSTVVYGSQALNVIGADYKNLSLEGTTTKEAYGDITMSGVLSRDGAILDMNGKNLEFASTVSFTGSGTIMADERVRIFTNNKVTGNFYFDGSSLQSIHSDNDGVTFENLFIANNVYSFYDVTADNLNVIAMNTLGLENLSLTVNQSATVAGTITGGNDIILHYSDLTFNSLINTGDIIAKDFTVTSINNTNGTIETQGEVTFNGSIPSGIDVIEGTFTYSGPESENNNIKSATYTDLTVITNEHTLAGDIEVLGTLEVRADIDNSTYELTIGGNGDIDYNSEDYEIAGNITYTGIDDNTTRYLHNRASTFQFSANPAVTGTTDFSLISKPGVDPYDITNGNEIDRTYFADYDNWTQSSLTLQLGFLNSEKTSGELDDYRMFNTDAYTYGTGSPSEANKISTGTQRTSDEVGDEFSYVSISDIDFGTNDGNSYLTAGSEIVLSDAPVTFYTIANDGDWTTGGTTNIKWDEGYDPEETDPAVVKHTGWNVTGEATCEDLTVKDAGNLTIDANKTLSVANNVSIGTTTSGTLTVNGTLTRNRIPSLDLSMEQNFDISATSSSVIVGSAGVIGAGNVPFLDGASNLSWDMEVGSGTTVTNNGTVNIYTLDNSGTITNNGALNIGMIDR
jgi:hypothetical protein